MNLSPNFTLAEFIVSSMAVRLGIGNNPTPPIVDNLRRLATFMEAVRTTLGNKGIKINSGYRSPMLNTAIGGSANSAHLQGRAADFICPKYGTPTSVVQRLADSGLAFDKLILEFPRSEGGGWVHIQIPRYGDEPKKMLFTAVTTSSGTKYLSGIHA